MQWSGKLKVKGVVEKYPSSFDLLAKKFALLKSLK